MPSELVLIVNDRAYAGWQDVRVSRSIESLCGSFELTVSDRWADQDVSWPIVEEDACRIEVDGTVLIDGYVDKRSLSLSRPLSVSGRDRASALVDSSAVLDAHTYRNLSVVDIAQKLADPFGLRVSIQPGLALARPAQKTVINPGETSFEVLARCAKAAGVLVVSDGRGGILITRAGAKRAATPLVQGHLLEAAVEFDGSNRFHRYIVASQVSTTEWLNGKSASPATPEAATQIRAEAIDLGVRRRDRVLLIRPEHGMTTAIARQRADWEARVRAAKAETVQVTVQGWRQPNGDLWPLNAIVGVHLPRLGVNGDMLISHVDLAVGEQGQITKMSLVRPDAFTPAPNGQVKGTGAWKDI